MTPGTAIPELVRTPTAVDLFMFSAAAWLVHRIHYDVPYTVEHEGHPGLLIHGPLQGVYLMQAAQAAMGGRRLRAISYRHSAPAHLGDTLTCGGSIGAVDEAGGTVTVDVWAKKQDDTVTTKGRAVFEEA
jgi:hydroxyacyl-ACP dehydratase HTD2-like protein with hotdog domain